LLAQAQPGQLPPPARDVPAPVQPPSTIVPPQPTTKGGLSDLIGGFHPRLEGLPAGVRPPLGTTPVPDRRILDLYDRYVNGFKDPENTFDLVVGRPRIWFLRQAPFRIQVADPRIFDYTIPGREPRELILLGNSVGSTVLNMWFGNPDDPRDQTILSYLVNVLPDPEAKERLERVYKALEDEINRAFPDAYICLFLVGDKLVVTGQVKDAVEATQILSILRANQPAAGQRGSANIPVSVATLNLGPLGIDPTGQLRNALENYIIQGETNIVNLLRIPGEQQVMLKVTVAEVSRSAARSIGLNATFRNKAGIQYFAQLTGTVNANLPAIIDNGEISLNIEALRSVNMARSLAEPNLVTLNGQPAFFQAGGEFPVPIVTGATAVGLQGVSFVPFGVLLQFVPFISDKDKIRLQLFANISTRDVALTTNIGGAGVPGLTTRFVQTVVEMREGQTLCIAGLLQTNLGGDSTRVPGAGDLPIIGNLFRVSHTQASESELVLLVTPELVHPMEPKEIPPLPGSDYFEPGDLEFYLLGRLESLRPYDYRSPVMTTIQRMCAYRHCELLYFAGPHGHVEDPAPHGGPGQHGPADGPGPHGPGDHP
jgi:pilus assembly protein CpaC